MVRKDSPQQLKPVEKQGTNKAKSGRSKSRSRTPTAHSGDKENKDTARAATNHAIMDSEGEAIKRHLLHERSHEKYHTLEM